jgi:trafficking protein particle complex subunit 8
MKLSTLGNLMSFRDEHPSPFEKPTCNFEEIYTRSNRHEIFNTHQCTTKPTPLTCLMTSQGASPVLSPHESDSEASINVPRQRPNRSPLGSIDRLPYRRSNASLSNLFASTTSLPTKTGSDGTRTPPSATVNGSVFSPTASTTIRSPSPTLSTRLGDGSSDTKDVIIRAFSPHVSILASNDTEELVRHKGIHGGLLELLRPFGEHVPGKVTIRDSNGASRSWEDFAVRFVGVKDGLESPRAPSRNSTDSVGGRNGQRASMLEYKPARLRTGGDVLHIEELVERHLTFAEEQSGPIEADYLNYKESETSDPQATSPFFLLYLRRLLSGLPLVPSETTSHPVASVIAISSRSPAPIEELRTLYASSNTGEHRLPQWVHNEFLRYYVLIHDEDYDDIQKSMNLYDQMKRHFGLHCHLLRLRSTQCVPSDDDVTKLPQCEWTAATEELAEITRREASEDDEDPTPCIFESDASNIKAFVREMVTQSIIPSMERASATWNDQVASRRRGISGRFMSLSKRFTTFGSNRNSSVPSLGGSSSNYDSLQGFYRPDAAEAVMRRLADYSMMLRDYKLAQSTYEILCQDFKNDKAWRHYAAANEMAAVSTLISVSGLSSKVRVEAVDQYIETAYYSYITRVGAPYYALRSLILSIELLKLRGGSALDDGARWASKILDDRLVGPVGHVLLMERIAACYTERQSVAGLSSGERRRKAAFWNLLACDAWLRLEKGSRAERCIGEATRLYNMSEEAEKEHIASDDNAVAKHEAASPGPGPVSFEHMRTFLSQLQQAVKVNRSGPQHFDGEDLLGDESTLVETLQDDNERLARRPSGAGLPTIGHRKSLSVNAAGGAAPPQLQTVFDPLGAVPSAYETTPNTMPRRPSVISAGAGVGGLGIVPLSPHAENLPGAPTMPTSALAEKRDDGFE